MSETAAVPAREDPRTYVVSGVLSALIGLFTLAVVFAPLATLLGWQAHRQGSRAAGAVLMGLGVAELLAWGALYVARSGGAF